MQGTWKCTEPDCHAMMFTRAVNEIQVDNRGHNHPRRGHYQKIHEQDYETIVVNEGSPPLLFDNLNPKPEKWYTTPVPLHVTQKYISFRGYSYRVEKIFNKNNTVAWVCPNASCESRLITQGVHQIWFDSLDHSHTSGKKTTVEATARKPLEQPKGRRSVVENVQSHQDAQNDKEQVAVEAPKPTSDDVRVTRSSKRSVDPPTSKTRRKSSIPQKNSTPNERSGSPQTERRSSVASSPSSNPLMVWIPNSGENETPKVPAESIKVD